VRGYISPLKMLQTLICEEALKGWGVTVSMTPGGGAWVGYRNGVDAVWTGLGLPSEEMSYEERLGVGAYKERGEKDKVGMKENVERTNKRSRNNSEDGGGSGRIRKDLRKAYYRKSLIWHPDRWASMPSLYGPAVQGAFELISSAYLALSGTDNPV
jgi:hypothetical protein